MSKKEKDPAFLLYSNDFLSECSDLTFEERGQYITMWCLQQQTGHLSEKIIKLNIPNISKDVLSKFSKDKNGFFYDKTLEKIIENRKEYSKKQSERAKKRWKNKPKQEQPNTCQSNAVALPVQVPNKCILENVIVIINNNINYNKKYKLYKTNLNTNIFEFIEKNYQRNLTAIEIKKIQNWVESLEDIRLLYKAIEISIMSDAKNFNYVEGILNNWIGSNIKTIEQVPKNYMRNKRKETKPKWFDKEIETREATLEELKEMEELLAKYN